MKIAVVGGANGKLDQIYKDVEEVQLMQGFLVDLLVICGDVQTARGINDLKCMAAPEEYLVLGDFQKYFMGEKKAILMTIVIGGVQECWNYFQTLPYGGWLAPNIYYMGNSNVIKFKGVRIGGISGIFHKDSLNKGRYEKLPYNEQTRISVFHTRYLESFRMLQLREKLDIMITHDLPKRIYKTPGLKEYLSQSQDSQFVHDLLNGKIGSPLHEILLNKIRPKNWFSSHTHMRFDTCYTHEKADQISLSKNSSTSQKTEQTYFLALDRCAVNRKYFEVVNVKGDEFDISGLEYDPEWLAILRLTNKYESTQEYPTNLPPPPNDNPNYDLDEEVKRLKDEFANNFKVPENFKISSPYDLGGGDKDPDRKLNVLNEQTSQFCTKLCITDPMQLILNRTQCKVINPERIDIDEAEEPDWIENESISISQTANHDAGYDVNMDYENSEMLAIEPPPPPSTNNHSQRNGNHPTIAVQFKPDPIVPFQPFIKREREEMDFEVLAMNRPQVNESTQQSEFPDESKSVDEPNPKRIKNEPLYFFIDTRGEE